MAFKKIPVTIELEAHILVGCGQMVAVGGNDPSQYPVEVVVERTLAGLIDWAWNNGWIQRSEVEEYTKEMLAQMFSIIPDDSPTGGAPKLDMGRSPSDSEEITDEDIAMLNAAVGIQDEKTAGLVAAVDQATSDLLVNSAKRTTEPTETVDVDVSIDLLQVNRMDIDNLAKLAPKDQLIEKVVKGIVTPEYKAALEIVYTKMPLDLWGTKIVEDNINQLLQKHKGAQ